MKSMTRMQETGFHDTTYINRWFKYLNWYNYIFKPISPLDIQRCKDHLKCLKLKNENKNK